MDISCGDPRYAEADGKDPGFSLVVARTERGREIIEGATEKGYVTLKPTEHWKLVRSRSGLPPRKGAIWGRRLALRLFGLPVTRFAGLALWHCWCQISVADKFRSTPGTVRRNLTRTLFRRLRLKLQDSVSARPAAVGIANRSFVEGVGGRPRTNPTNGLPCNVFYA